MTLLFCALALQKPLEGRILPGLTDVEVVFDPTTELVRRIDDGASPDAVIAVTGAIDGLAARGAVDAASVVPVGRMGLGVAVALDAPSPDIGSREAMIATLLAARSVAYSQAGASGIYLRDLLARLGVLDEIAARATVLEKGFTARAIVDGRADLAIQQLSELAFVPGVQIAGPFPDELQTYTEFSLATRPGAPAAVRELAGVLAGERARLAYRSSGFAD